ncbi:MAG: SDR family oxidoreductase [Pseudomonadota bacterium]|nr:SDR family oxidoreductase [Pseudomonadota bacterium]
MKTVLITGCSSGFGLDTARYFLARDWHVIATMRTVRDDLLPASPNLRLLALDVTDAASIAQAIAAAGPIDVLVNNAGIGMLATLEGTSMEIARDVFATNALGTIAMTQAVLPQFRVRGAGVVINVTSTVTVVPLPFLSVYTASKAAVNAFTEALAVELQSFGIRLSLVLPGRSPTTRFGANASGRMQGGFPEAYVAFKEKVFAAMGDASEVTYGDDVAEAVWRAATDPTSPLKIAAGADAVAWAADSGDARFVTAR